MRQTTFNTWLYDLKILVKLSSLFFFSLSLIMDYLPLHQVFQFLQDSLLHRLTFFIKVLPDIEDYLGIQSCQTPPDLLDLLEVITGVTAVYSCLLASQVHISVQPSCCLPNTVIAKWNIHSTRRNNNKKILSWKWNTFYGLFDWIFMQV